VCYRVGYYIDLFTVIFGHAHKRFRKSKLPRFHCKVLFTGSDIIVPFCRLSLTRDSFVSATIREWTNLNLSVCNLDTLSKFKKAIRSSISMPILRHYSYGPRKLNIILTQLRCNASFLNYDLCKIKILSNASWTVAHHVKILTEIELRIAFLNLDNVSRLRPERLKLFHSLTVARTK
jgi:hypothetical protein